jgi:DNA helicase-2/ATP-dependent DNA helicase PcrA
MSPIIHVDAEMAAESALAEMIDALDCRASFVLEAGAGAGKTYSLVRALRHLIATSAPQLLRRDQKIACITFTNAARDEIESRTDRHPIVYAATIHSFCWSQLSRHQVQLREMLMDLPKWPERLEESGGIRGREVRYDDRGFASASSDEFVSLAHDDIPRLMAAILGNRRFRGILVDRFPIILVDEYQDTDLILTEGFKTHLLDTEANVQLGFFGDPWQKIYGDGCGALEHSRLRRIEKHANFRSRAAIVGVLNRMRPDLPQVPADQTAEESISVFTTNDWVGTRRSTAPWKNDLPSDVAHEFLQSAMKRLELDGWDFSPAKTKILMLTHNVLASEQGYRELAEVFSRSEYYIKKEDPHIAYLIDVLEPATIAFGSRRYGDMFASLGGRHKIKSPVEKQRWFDEMDQIVEMQRTGTVGDVMDLLLSSSRIILPGRVEGRERDLLNLSTITDEIRLKVLQRLTALRGIPYVQVKALSEFVDGHTPFSTKHGVKGQEFQNVLVVVGKGWTMYNFNQMLEWVATGVPTGKEETFARSRNLFYVACSRPIARLALLFTEQLSGDALGIVGNWFGSEHVLPLSDPSVR